MNIRDLQLLTLACRGDESIPLSYKCRIFECGLMTASQYTEATTQLTSLGLLVKQADARSGDWMFYATDRGRAHLAQILALNLPRSLVTWEGANGENIPPAKIHSVNS